jgi:putative heme-binding domain-containing protein
MKAVRSVFTLLFSCSLVTASFIQCSHEKAIVSSESRDTTVRVYGPYIAERLPLTKGVKMGNPIQLVTSPQGVLFAANQTGEVYALYDSDNDSREDSAALYCNVNDFGLRSPVGLVFNGDTLYVGTSSQIRAFIDLTKDGKADSSWVFHDNIPQSEHPYEWTSGLRFGPDGWLYCAITTDSWNAGPAPDPGALRGSIVRVSPNGKKIERIASGIRSVPGMTFNDQGDLFFIDNEGGGNPTEELNRLVVNGFYGHNKRKYPSDSSRTIQPDFDLRSEVAPSSIEFNSKDNDFGGAGGDLFVSFYGPGERWTRGAIGRVVMQRQADGSYQYQEYTIADVPKLADLAFGKNGALYVAHHGKADYWYNSVYKEQGGFYRITYDPSINTAGNYVRQREPLNFSANSVEMGKQLFAELGCLGCHHVDGTTELLGPNLRDISKSYSRAEILEEILKPSARIKPSMGGVRITKKDGQVLLGRVVNSDTDKLSFMLVGNQTVSILRKDIATMEDEKKSLMYENLLHEVTDEQRNALLDFLMSSEQVVAGSK